MPDLRRPPIRLPHTFFAKPPADHPRKQLLDLIRWLEEVDRRLGGDGPRKIQAAIAGALDEIR